MYSEIMASCTLASEGTYRKQRDTDVQELAWCLHQERLHLSSERELLQILNKDVARLQDELAQMSWLCSHARSYLSHLKFLQNKELGNLSPGSCRFPPPPPPPRFVDIHRKLPAYMSAYGNLLSGLRSRPGLIAVCLAAGGQLSTATPKEACDDHIEAIYAGVFGSGLVDSDEEGLLLVLGTLFDEEFSRAMGIHKMPSGKTCLDKSCSPEIASEKMATFEGEHSDREAMALRVACRLLEIQLDDTSESENHNPSVFCQLFRKFVNGLPAVRLYLAVVLHEPLMALVTCEIDLDGPQGEEGTDDETAVRIAEYASAILESLHTAASSFPPGLAALFRRVHGVLQGSCETGEKLLGPEAAEVVCGVLLFAELVLPAVQRPATLGLIEEEIIDGRLHQVLHQVSVVLFMVATQNDLGPDDDSFVKNIFRRVDKGLMKNFLRTILSQPSNPQGLPSSTKDVLRLAALLTHSQLQSLVEFLNAVRSSEELSLVNSETLSSLLARLPSPLSGSRNVASLLSISSDLSVISSQSKNSKHSFSDTASDVEVTQATRKGSRAEYGSPGTPGSKRRLFNLGRSRHRACSQQNVDDEDWDVLERHGSEPVRIEEVVLVIPLSGPNVVLPGLMTEEEVLGSLFVNSSWDDDELSELAKQQGEPNEAITKGNCDDPYPKQSQCSQLAGSFTDHRRDLDLQQRDSGIGGTSEDDPRQRQNFQGDHDFRFQVKEMLRPKAPRQYRTVSAPAVSCCFGELGTNIPDAGSSAVHCGLGETATRRITRDLRWNRLQQKESELFLPSSSLLPSKSISSLAVFSTSMSLSTSSSSTTSSSSSSSSSTTSSAASVSSSDAISLNSDLSPTLLPSTQEQKNPVEVEEVSKEQGQCPEEQKNGEEDKNKAWWKKRFSMAIRRGSILKDKVKNEDERTEAKTDVTTGEPVPSAVDDILDKYRSFRKRPSTISLPATKVGAKDTTCTEEDTRKGSEEQADGKRQPVTLREAKQKLRVALSTFGPLAFAGTRVKEGAEDAVQLLDWLLKSHQTQAWREKDRGQVARLGEARRCLRDVSPQGCKKLLNTLADDYRRRQAYVEYLARSRHGLEAVRNSMEKALRLLSCEKELTERQIVAFHVDAFLHKKPALLQSFVTGFKSRTMVDEQASFLRDILQTLNLGLIQEARWLPDDVVGLHLLHEALECHVMACIFPTAFHPNQDGDIMRDQVFSEHIERVRKTVCPTNSILLIPAVYHSAAPWQAAQDELRMITTYKTPNGKVSCVLRTCTVIVNLLNLAKEGSGQPGADDCIPVLVYVILQANPPGLLSTVQFVNNFHPKELTGETAYWWLQFCSAVEFIKTIDERSENVH